jgi:hypothetical protein
VSLAAVAVVSAGLLAGPPPVEPTPAAPIVIDGEPISRGHLRHWAGIARRARAGDAARLQVAGTLIRYRWIREETGERGLVVTAPEVERAFRRHRDAAFPTRRAYRRWRRESGQTPEDIRLRVRMELLSDRLRELAIDGATAPDEQQARIGAFTRDFIARWRPRTVCRPPWISRDCGAVR